MKLLIVDDEQLTREGLIHSIDWTSLNISQVLQADDGLHGYEAAKKTRPDMVLTDVRMPRMNGIEMSERIQLLYPDCPIIFMSGYSDKEYLKAAIKLKAVRYVEKPIDPLEVTEAIHAAALSVVQKKLQMKSYGLLQKEASSSLALRLTKPDFSAALEETALSELNLPIRSSSYFTTVILKFSRRLTDFIDTELSDLLASLDSIAEKRGLHQIHTLKHEEFLILHLFGNERPLAYTLERICKDLYELLKPHEQFFIVAGKSVQGIHKAYMSYHSAVILLQNSFFYDYGSILLYQDSKAEPAPPSIQSLPEQFLKLLSEKNIQEAKALADKLYHQLWHNHSLLPNQVKDVYYKIFTHINTMIYQLKLSVSPNHLDTESLMELLARCSTLSQLHLSLMERLQEFERLLTETKPENSTIFLIRDYIGQHYGDDTLSIKDISDHVHLSTSYLCTIFKMETGQTLNQYITEFRIEKAKQLLKDSRNRISEISAKVGYADGNYFSKSFKKTAGLSPSEYRERELL